MKQNNSVPNMCVFVRLWGLIIIIRSLIFTRFMIRWRSIKLNHENYHTFPPGSNFNALATYNSNFTANGSAMTDSFRADSSQQPNVQLFLQAFVLIYLF